MCSTVYCFFYIFTNVIYLSRFVFHSMLSAEPLCKKGGFFYTHQAVGRFSLKHIDKTRQEKIIFVYNS